MPPRSHSVQDGGAVILMLSQVSVQVGLLSKTSFTKVALVGLLLIMNVANVSLQVATDRKRSLTKLTFVRLFSCVCS